MDLRPMKYKDFVWPHNPRIYSISFERNISVTKVPFGRYLMKDMGMTYRVLKGEGEFCGEGAYEDFRRLGTLFYDEGPGKLWHPIWQETNAYFVSLSLKQEPQPDYVSYSFEFWETYDLYKNTVLTVAAPAEQEKTEPAQRKSHTVVSGDTMCAIAVKNGMTLARLVELNPQVKNPNRIYPGDVIWLS